MKKYGGYLGQSGRRFKTISIIFIFVIKNKKDTHYNKTNGALFSGTIGVFSRAFKTPNEQIYK